MGLPSREAKVTSVSHFYSVTSTVTDKCLGTQWGQGKVCPERSSAGKEGRERERVQEGAVLAVSLPFLFLKRADINVAKC